VEGAAPIIQGLTLLIIFTVMKKRKEDNYESPKIQKGIPSGASAVAGLAK
jgi:hypothetical protein